MVLVVDVIIYIRRVNLFRLELSDFELCSTCVPIMLHVHVHVSMPHNLKVSV